MRMLFYFPTRLLLGLAVALGGALTLIGCDTVGTSGSTDEGGQLSVLLTDAPGDILEANVTIERVAVVPSTDTASGDADKGGLEVLSKDTMDVDLMQLQNGVTKALGSITIPEGNYSQIRLKTARNATVYYEDANGDRQKADLMLPSADETGVKINFKEFTVGSAQDSIEVTLDFNVQESFVEAGQAGKYIFKPVVHAQSIVANGDTTTTSDG